MGRTIVVGVDGSDGSRQALAWAIDEARIRRAPLEVLCTWEYPPFEILPGAATSIDPAGLEEAASATLEHALADVDTEGIEVIRKAPPGPAALALVERSETAALVVVGSRGRGGFRGLLLGSVSQHLVAHARGPVVVVRAPAD